MIANRWGMGELPCRLVWDSGTRLFDLMRARSRPPAPPVTSCHYHLQTGKNRIVHMQRLFFFLYSYVASADLRTRCLGRLNMLRVALRQPCEVGFLGNINPVPTPSGRGPVSLPGRTTLYPKQPRSVVGATCACYCTVVSDLENKTRWERERERGREGGVPEQAMCVVGL